MFFQKYSVTELSVPCDPFNSTLNRKCFVGFVFVCPVLQLVNMCMLFMTCVYLSIIALKPARWIVVLYHLQKLPPTLPHCCPFSLVDKLRKPFRIFWNPEIEWKINHGCLRSSPCPSNLNSWKESMRSSTLFYRAVLQYWCACLYLYFELGLKIYIYTCMCIYIYIMYLIKSSYVDRLEGLMVVLMIPSLLNQRGLWTTTVGGLFSDPCKTSLTCVRGDM